MRRREFIALLGGAAATSSGVWTLAARAQQPVVPEIGILNSVSLGPIVDRVEALLESLEDSGFVYGQNLAIEYRSAEGQGALLPELAADLVARNPQAIVCLTRDRKSTRLN